jgi:hypothetical protein
MDQTEQITLKFRVGSTNYTVPLGLRILFDQQTILETPRVNHEIEIEHTFSDDDGEHELAIELFGKTAEHTKIDQAGEIVSDSVLTVDGIEIDAIDLNFLFQQLATYTHDFNGTQALTEQKFFGALGCNGVVKFKFTTPVYLWFLENM